jgi:hypothetical protein
MQSYCLKNENDVICKRISIQLLTFHFSMVSEKHCSLSTTNVQWLAKQQNAQHSSTEGILRQLMMRLLHCGLLMDSTDIGTIILNS